jgi:hypothetical protein
MKFGTTAGDLKVGESSNAGTPVYEECAYLYDVDILRNVFKIALIFNKVRPPRTQFRVFDVTILDFQAEVCIGS